MGNLRIWEFENLEIQTVKVCKLLKCGAKSKLEPA
jgi:hypothetical protein